MISDPWKKAPLSSLTDFPNRYLPRLGLSASVAYNLAGGQRIFQRTLWPRIARSPGDAWSRAPFWRWRPSLKSDVAAILDPTKNHVGGPNGTPKRLRIKLVAARASFGLWLCFQH